MIELPHIILHSRAKVKVHLHLHYTGATNIIAKRQALSVIMMYTWNHKNTYSSQPHLATCRIMSCHCVDEKGIGFVYMVYKLAANTMSLFIRVDASSIFWYSPGSPITLAALRTSLQVSSSRWMQRTIIPEGEGKMMNIHIAQQVSGCTAWLAGL